MTDNDRDIPTDIWTYFREDVRENIGILIVGCILLCPAIAVLVAWVARLTVGMKLCNARCVPLCDFCIWYAFNGIGPGWQVYDGDGFCRIDEAARWPEDACLNFVCQNWKGGSLKNISVSCVSVIQLRRAEMAPRLVTSGVGEVGP